MQLPGKSLLEKADQTAPIDFLRSADEDTPNEGSWSVQSERGPGVDSCLVKLRSLQKKILKMSRNTRKHVKFV